MAKDVLKNPKLSAIMERYESEQSRSFDDADQLDDDDTRLKSAMTAVDRQLSTDDGWVSSIVQKQISMIVEMQKSIFEHVEDARQRELQAQRQMSDLGDINDALFAAIEKLKSRSMSE